MRQIRLEWLRSATVDVALAEVEAYLRVEPKDPWALREKALILLRARKPEAALASAELAEQIDPRSPTSAGIVGQVLLALRRFGEARVATERALRVSIDADWLFPQLLQACPTFEERRAAVEFLRHELSRQSSFGSSFLAFQTVATGVIPPGDLLVAVESLRVAQPTHWETWAAAVQQKLAVGKMEEAVALAQEATQRFPLLARLRLDLADAHRGRNEAAEEIAALEKARELSPGWAWPAVRLATVYVGTAKPEAAEAVLRAARRHDPLDARLGAEHARALWQLDRRDEAMQCVEQAIASSPASGLAWNLLGQWARELGQPEKVIAVARKLAEQRPGDPEPLWRLAQELGGAGKTAEALEQIDAALRLDATHANAHDSRAVLLAELGRYDEAIAACAPAAFGNDTPYELCGRAAWIEWMRGNRAGAVAQMRALLEKQPDYSWGWQLLSDWLDQLGEPRAAADAAERYAALNPASPYPLGYIGDLRRKAGEKKRAAEAFRRALRLEPRYLFAAFALLEFDCEFSEWDEAAHVLALIKQQASSWQGKRAEILYHRWRKDADAAVRVAKELVHAPEHERDTLLAAAHIFKEAGWSGKLARAIEACWTDAATNAEAGAIWMRARLEAGGTARVRKLLRSAAGTAFKQRALSVYVESLGERKRWLRLIWLVWRQRTLLTAAEVTWGSVGYALAQAGLRRWLVRWMSDWPRREKLQPWMLYNLTAALLELGRDDEAAAVVRRALELPADGTRPAFVAWSAHGAALRGEIEQARRHLAVFDAPQDFFASKAVAELARALVELNDTPPEERRRVFADIRRKLGTRKNENPGAYALAFVRRAHAQTQQKLAALAKADFWRLWYAVPVLRIVFGGAAVPTATLAMIGLLVVGGIVGALASDRPAIAVVATTALICGFARGRY